MPSGVEHAQKLAGLPLVFDLSNEKDGKLYTSSRVAEAAVAVAFATECN